MEENCDIKTSKEIHAELNTSALKVLLNAEVPLVLLDARAPKWDDGRRILGARLLTSEASEEEVARVIPNKKALIFVYCSNMQCGASGRLQKRLREIGYPNVLKYAEGIDGWLN